MTIYFKMQNKLYLKKFKPSSVKLSIANKSILLFELLENREVHLVHM